MKKKNLALNLKEQTSLLLSQTYRFQKNGREKNYILYEKNIRSEYISFKTLHKPSNASSLFEPGNLENQPGFEQQHFRALICLFHLTYPLSPVNCSSYKNAGLVNFSSIFA